VLVKASGAEVSSTFLKKRNVRACTGMPFKWRDIGKKLFHMVGFYILRFDIPS
jgi:hypothetical protein